MLFMYIIVGVLFLNERNVLLFARGHKTSHRQRKNIYRKWLLHDAHCPCAHVFLLAFIKTIYFSVSPTLLFEWDAREKHVTCCLWKTERAQAPKPCPMHVVLFLLTR